MDLTELLLLAILVALAFIYSLIRQAGKILMRFFNKDFLEEIVKTLRDKK